MADFTLAPFQPERYDEWNVLVSRSNEGTIFHGLDFLRYHGDRFAAQEHHLMWHKGRTLVAIMPMAIFEENGCREAQSPYGASYGGPVFLTPLSYSQGRKVAASIVDYMSSRGMDRFTMTLPISCCYEQYCETFRLALLQEGFEIIKREISSVVQIASGLDIMNTISARSRNMIRKAQNKSVSIERNGHIEAFWAVLKKTFEKHGAKPTHTRRELEWLCEHLPDRIRVHVAYLGDQPVAGMVLFVINSRVHNSFYLCQDPQFQDTQALSFLIYSVLEQAQSESVKWFDFGPSSVNMQGKENIFRFKESFGAIGQFRDTLRWTRAPAAFATDALPSRRSETIS